MNSAIQTAFDSWTPPFATIAMLLLTAAIYARGFARLHRQVPERFPVWRLAMFMGGIAALFVAIASPLEAFDDLLLQIHMTQHLLLMIVAPPLILAGAPAIAIVRGLPPTIAKAIVGPLLRSSRVRRLFAWLTEPLVCWIAFVAATWGWHLPATFQLALRSDGWHVVEHACFFTTALMFWYPVIQPWPSVARWPRWAMLPYLLLADGQNTILAALFMFSGRLIYPVYATMPPIAGFTPLGDQIVAGAIMWVPGSIFYLVPAVLIMLQMLAPQSLRSPLPLFPSPEGRGVRGEVSRATEHSASAR
ncbi:MAG: cytochrome c oxidase assembly protein [Candidatus Binatus sp.]|uniref:cytochrome c oxidase assembly protein n=3 Tax=Candidatus Binatus sp. TaxID=2811406 RepID=UPI003C76C676